MLDLRIEKCRESAMIPKYAHTGDAGMDLYAAEDVTVLPGKSALVPIGIKMAIPLGYEVQIRPRSGVSYKTLIRLPNAPGTIDCGYRGELNVLVYNASDREDAAPENPFTMAVTDCPHGTYLIRRGDRIAQMVFAKVEYCRPVVVSSVESIGEDRGGGFGSSGV